jgi:hypothetical protein
VNFRYVCENQPIEALARLRLGDQAINNAQAMGWIPGTAGGMMGTDTVDNTRILAKAIWLIFYYARILIEVERNDAYLSYRFWVNL